jgi:tRNA modification GTPase
LDFDADATGHVPEEELKKRLAGAEVALEEALGFEVQRAAPVGLARVVLAGAPNAGKSALFNALVGEEGALVSEHAGTTRDALEARIEVGGQEFRLMDTAGLDESAVGPDLDAQGVARSARAEADLVVWVVDARTVRREQLAAERSALGERPVLLAWNKVDVAPRAPPDWTGELGVVGLVPVSAITGTGLDRLKSSMGRALESASSMGLERETALRHRSAIELALGELGSSRAILEDELPLELVAEHVRRACDALDAVSGATTAEDVLDRIFARFCLGK